MAFLDHIDPGNSSGSITTPSSKFKYKPKPTVYKCEYCEREFGTDTDKRHHKMKKHPLRKPYLFITGGALTATEKIIRSRLEPNDIAFEDTDSIKINTEEFSDLSSAKKYLLDNQKGGVDVTLGYENYLSTHRLIFDLADQSALSQIDTIFYRVFSSNIPMASRFEIFNDQVQEVEGNGLSYAGALGCYIMAIMTKDRAPGVAAPYSTYIDRLGEAQDKLQGITTPLAYALSSIIAFMLNDLSKSTEDHYMPQLSAAKNFLKFGKNEQSESNERNGQKIPIDIITEQILNHCESPITQRQGHIASFEKLYNSPITPPKDKLKLALILYNAAKSNNQYELTRYYEKQLSHSTLNLYTKMNSEGDKG
jgi:hypothetical protein